MDKTALRKTISAQKRALTPLEIDTMSQALTEKFLAHPLYQKATAIFGYLPYNQEVRTVPLLEQAQKDGKRVAVPKVFGDTMEFLWLDDLTQVAPGAYNIPEPILDTPIALDETALVLMPGLAFDRDGNRMGYGGGFYDKYLELHPNHPTIALCYHFQILDHVETEAHDIPVDAVLWD